MAYGRQFFASVMRIGAITLPIKPIASVLRSTHDSSLADAAIIGNEVGHILVFEEMVIPFDIKLEPQAFADKGNGYAGASPAEFGIAREVDAQVRSDLPLRLRGRDRPCGRREHEKNAALHSQNRLSGLFHAARTAAVSVPLD